jgi:hypothetical protein
MVNDTEQQMLDQLTEPQLRNILNLLMTDENSVPEILRQMARDAARKRRERVMRNNMRYEQALSQMTDKQSLETSKLEGNGYKINQVFWHKQDPQGNVAVMMVKDQVYDDISGKVKQKIVVVYSNGTFDSTFEKKITMRKVL